MWEQGSLECIQLGHCERGHPLVQRERENLCAQLASKGCTTYFVLGMDSSRAHSHWVFKVPGPHVDIRTFHFRSYPSLCHHAHQLEPLLPVGMLGSSSCSFCLRLLLVSLLCERTV